MKNCVKKCVMVLAVLAIVLGIVAITGCEAKKSTAPAKAPATKACEKAPAPKK